jgi:murein DD-endopeptidase MepM/ murein hydrolase activator NlpD
MNQLCQQRILSFKSRQMPLLKKTEQSILSSIKKLNASDDLYVRIAADSQYYQYKCGNTTRTYPAFRVYQKGHGHTPLFYLGVSANETAVFSKLTSLAKTSAMNFLSDVGREVTIPKVGHEGNITDESGAVVSSIRPRLRPVVEENSPMEGNVEAEPEKDIELVETSSPVNKETLSSLERVTCMGSRTLNIRNEELDKVLFKATLGETVKVFQSWGQDEMKRTIGGVEYTFVKVEFSNRESNDEKVGYVANSFIKEKEKCAYLRKGRREDMGSLKITGLNDGKCCDFPTEKKPTHSYTSGMRRFGAGRSGGKRAHAACDLYRFINEPFRSVAPGKVISDLYYFYQGTYAIEVKHSGGFIVRYGEITGKRPADKVRGGRLRKNSPVVMGQRLGYIGKVNSGCCRPMLHFELYRGNKSGSLSRKSGRYRRRSDLLNPTEYLLRWEDDVF